MMILLYRGLEYRAHLEGSEDPVVVVTMAAADGRLLESEYYRARKDRWFDRAESSMARVFPAANADLELTEAEGARLKEILDSGAVRTHGWYDVAYVRRSWDEVVV